MRELTHPCVEPDGTINADHDWQPREARAHLDSRTYAVVGITYTWQCSQCNQMVTGSSLEDARPLPAGQGSL